MDLTSEFVFYMALSIVFADLTFFVLRKVLDFAESLINTKFNFGKIQLNKNKKGD
jgi:hypothetical protein